MIHYLPLCCTSTATPQCKYSLVEGRDVENVLPYNSVMKKKTGQERGLGPAGEWADAEHHRKVLKKKRITPTAANWKVAMDWAQKVTKIALYNYETRTFDRYIWCILCGERG